MIHNHSSRCYKYCHGLTITNAHHIYISIVFSDTNRSRSTRISRTHQSHIYIIHRRYLKSGTRPMQLTGQKNGPSHVVYIPISAFATKDSGCSRACMRMLICLIKYNFKGKRWLTSIPLLLVSSWLHKNPTTSTSKKSQYQPKFKYKEVPHLVSSSLVTTSL
jgi:hypothetical protein